MFEQDFQASLGKSAKEIQKTIQILDGQNFVSRFWKGEPSLWKSDSESQEKIKKRLGWLTISDTMAKVTPTLVEFGQSIKKGGVQDVVLLGMGGSSLCPEVCRDTYGVAPGYPQFWVLDSTDPLTILHLEEKLNLKKTLFILASKSGSTIEVHSLYRYFYEKIKTLGPDAPGKHFIAITDPGSQLDKIAREAQFREIFLNPPDIGGRYSALSYFGLVPAALFGIDLNLFLHRANEMIQKCQPPASGEENPGIQLGVVLAEFAKEGRDKVTFITPFPIRSFGVWLEQLLAESTGKEGKGLIPVEGETVGKPDVYGNDRLFFYLKVASHPDPKLDNEVEALRTAGCPVVQISLRDPFDLAGEFFRWEMATAVVGALWRINPFDEPNVTESKENTQKILKSFQLSGHLPARKVTRVEQGISIYLDGQMDAGESLEEILRRFLRPAGPSYYLALMAYIERSEIHETLLQELRTKIRDRFKVATTLGYGPRYLHSTGQLHKGGTRKGLFFQITGDDPEEVAVPGTSYSFGVLKQAQALGDLDSLIKRGLPVLQLHLGISVKDGLNYLISVIGKVCK